MTRLLFLTEDDLSDTGKLQYDRIKTGTQDLETFHMNMFAVSTTEFAHADLVLFQHLETNLLVLKSRYLSIVDHMIDGADIKKLLTLLSS